MNKKSFVLYGLVCAAILGNLCNFNAFFGVDFVFGSIFALIIVAAFGLNAGVVCAFIASCFTVIQWEHFYAIPIFTLEVLVVGIIISRNNKIPIIIADMLFWLTIGLPSAYVCYRYGLKMTSGILNLMVFKQALNALFNASIASIIIFIVQAYYGGKPVMNLKNPSIRHIIFAGITFLLLGSSLLVVGIESRRGEMIRTRDVAANLTKYSRQIKEYLAVWHSDSIAAINGAARDISAGINEDPSKWLDGSGNLKSAYNNPDVQLAVDSFRHGRLAFDAVYVGNADGVSVSCYPVVNQQGDTTIGVDFSGRDYYSQLKKTLRPVVSEVFPSRVNSREPIITISTPIICNNKFMGYVCAGYRLSTLADQLKILQVDQNYTLNIVDSNTRIVLSTELGNNTLEEYKIPGFATRKSLYGGVQQFIPRSSDSLLSKYKDSLFVAQLPVGFSGWQIITAYRAQVIQQELVQFVSTAVMIIYFILLMGCPLTLLLSNMITRPLIALTQIKETLKIIKTTRNIDAVQWPDSFVAEISELSSGLKDMVRECLDVQDAGLNEDSPK